MRKFDLKKYKGSFVFDEEDQRDYKWDKIFGAITPASEELPADFSWHDKMISKVPYQGDIPSCVPCAFAMLQAFNSKQEYPIFDQLLSWRFPWANTSHSKRGSTFRDIAKTVQELGIAKEIYCPSDWKKGYEWIGDKENIDKIAYEDALIYRIKNYSYINCSPGSDDVRRAIMRQPAIIAVGGNSKDWKINKEIPIVRDTGKSDWAHAILAIGFRGSALEIVNWWGAEWGNNGYAYLQAGYPLLSAISVEDLPDNLIIKEPMRLGKLKDSTTIYLLNDFNMTAKPIFSTEDYFALTGDMEWKQYEIITVEELTKYKLVKGILVFER